MKNFYIGTHCPICKSELIEKEVLFLCSGCKKEYQIKDGIPVLVNLTKLSNHLVGQIEYFEKESIIENERFRLDEWQRCYLERFNKNFPDIKNKIILDCGAGSGYMSVELAKRGAAVVACDLNLKGLARLQKISDNLNLDIKIICCSAEELPLATDSVDFFISNAVLEHLPNEKMAIDEIGRVCRCGAGLMIAVPLSYRFLNPLLLPINYIHDKRIGHLRRYDKRSLENKFKNWDMQNVYYTGHTKKVIKTLVNILVKIFDNSEIEKEDAKKEKSIKWASNIICFFKKI